MTYDRWKDLFAAICLVSIVASLLLIGMQLKRSQEIALASQYQARAESAMNLYAVGLNAGFDWSAYLKQEGNRSKAEHTAIASINLWAWTAFDNFHYQRENGLLGDEEWIAFENQARDLYQSSSGRAAFEIGKQYLRASFVEYVEQLANETD